MGLVCHRFSCWAFCKKGRRVYELKVEAPFISLLLASMSPDLQLQTMTLGFMFLTKYSDQFTK